MPKQHKFYAVRRGHKPGIYNSWDECSKNVTQFKGASYKAFPTLEEAQRFMDTGEVTPSSSTASSSSSKESPHDNKKRAGPTKPYERSAPPQQSYKEKAGIDDSKYPMVSSRDIVTEFTPYNHDCTLKSNLKLAQRRAKLEEHQSSDALSKFKYTIVYTDGSCLGNGKKNGQVIVGGYGAFFGPNDARNISEPFTDDNPTNQRAEIKAALAALQHSVSNEENVRIFTDSQYLINSVCDWRWNWEVNSWTSSSGFDVANMDLLMPLFTLVDSRSGGVRWEYVPGHKGIPGNEEADRLAVEGSKASAQQQPNNKQNTK